MQAGQMRRLHNFPELSDSYHGLWTDRQGNAGFGQPLIPHTARAVMQGTHVKKSVTQEVSVKAAGDSKAYTHRVRGPQPSCLGNPSLEPTPDGVWVPMKPRKPQRAPRNLHPMGSWGRRAELAKAQWMASSGGSEGLVSEETAAIQEMQNTRQARPFETAAKQGRRAHARVRQGARRRGLPSTLSSLLRQEPPSASFPCNGIAIPNCAPPVELKDDKAGLPWGDESHDSQGELPPWGDQSHDSQGELPPWGDQSHNSQGELPCPIQPADDNPTRYLGGLVLGRALVKHGPGNRPLYLWSFADNLFPVDGPEGEPIQMEQPVEEPDPKPQFEIRNLQVREDSVALKLDRLKVQRDAAEKACGGQQWRVAQRKQGVPECEQGVREPRVSPHLQGVRERHRSVVETMNREQSSGARPLELDRKCSLGAGGGWGSGESDEELQRSSAIYIPTATMGGSTADIPIGSGRERQNSSVLTKQPHEVYHSGIYKTKQNGGGHALSVNASASIETATLGGASRISWTSNPM